MNLYIIFGDICTFAGVIGIVIVILAACIFVAMTQFNMPDGEKKVTELIIAFTVFGIIFCVGIGVRYSGGYISQNYDWIKTSERNNMVRDCPEDSTMSSYCAYKWKEYRIDSTEAADAMKKYLEKK